MRKNCLVWFRKYLILHYNLALNEAANFENVYPIFIMDDDIYESTSEVSKTTISSTVFTYGFGLNPMNNLQIDLLGVFNSDSSILDTDFYKSLQISFTLKFD